MKYQLQFLAVMLLTSVGTNLQRDIQGTTGLIVGILSYFVAALLGATIVHKIEELEETNDGKV